MLLQQLLKILRELNCIKIFKIPVEYLNLMNENCGKTILLLGSEEFDIKI